MIRQYDPSTTLYRASRQYDRLMSRSLAAPIIRHENDVAKPDLGQKMTPTRRVEQRTARPARDIVVAPPTFSQAERDIDPCLWRKSFYCEKQSGRREQINDVRHRFLNISGGVNHV